MIGGIVTYRKSAKSLYGFQGGGPHTMFRPGDLVCHRRWEGSLGLLVSKVSDDHMTVLWTKAPGLKRQQLDAMLDDGDVGEIG